MQIYYNRNVKVTCDVPSTYSYDKKPAHVVITADGRVYNHIYLEERVGGEYNIWYSWRSFGSPVVAAVEWCQERAYHIKQYYEGKISLSEITIDTARENAEMRL